MVERIELKASDGHRLQASVSRPAGKARGVVVVLQEIFGVTGHIRSVCDKFAAEGYVAIAPALFDRVKPGTELAYTDIPTGREIVGKIAMPDVMKDVAAAVEWGKAIGKVAVAGYCWGGTLAFVAAAKLPIAGAVAYYGGMIAKVLDQTPQVPVLYHFGGKDPYIPASDVEAIRAKLQPKELYVYPDAAHGFNCDERADWNPEAAALAWKRTTAFLAKVIP